MVTIYKCIEQFIEHEYGRDLLLVISVISCLFSKDQSRNFSQPSYGLHVLTTPKWNGSFSLRRAVLPLMSIFVLCSDFFKTKKKIFCLSFHFEIIHLLVGNVLFKLFSYWTKIFVFQESLAVVYATYCPAQYTIYEPVIRLKGQMKTQLSQRPFSSKEVQNILLEPHHLKNLQPTECKTLQGILHEIGGTGIFVFLFARVRITDSNFI